MAGAVNASRVHVIILLELGEHGVEEFEIVVALITGCGLPAGAFALRIGQLAGRVQSLWVNRNGFRPLSVQGKTACDLTGIAPVAVKHENQGSAGVPGGWRSINQRGAHHAVHGECQLLKAIRLRGACEWADQHQQ